MIKNKHPPTPLRLFFMFAQITSVTLGGGYVIVPVIGSALEKKGWMNEDDFFTIFAKAQAFPGPLAMSTAVLVSLKLCGFWGAFAAFWGILLPPFLALILISNLMRTYGSIPALKRFLAGAGAVVPGLVAAMIYKSARKRSWNVVRVAETLMLAILLALFPTLSLPILLSGIAILYGIETLCTKY